MRIGITGADGFIGTHLTNRLTAESIGYEVFDGDLLDAVAVDAFVGMCDLIIHLAGIFSDDFERLVAVNVVGTRNVVEACKKSGVERLLFSSTGAVYGEPARNGISREDDPLTPNTLYGLSKLYAEEYIRYSGISAVILRFPNVYGPGNEKGVIYNFLASIRVRKEVGVFGTGEQRRSFLFINDAVEAIMLAIGYSGREVVFNIADRESYSLNDVVNILRDSGEVFEVRHLDADDSNRLQSLSEDISKAESIFGWTPKTSLEEGIRSMICRA